ncbi:MAG TPA: hypothetical protein VHC98_00895 [Candidatus Saccharimonadales bacterium]|nr:hypothetical protein [Candidatus Saccharimonadales bacterium]
MDNAPAPEVLAPRSDGTAPSADGDSAAPQAPLQSTPNNKSRRHAYRPSHKATFIGLAVVALILGVNAVVIGVIIHNQSKQAQIDQGQVTINQSVLDKLGVDREAVGDSGIQLTIGPNTQFGGGVTIAGDTSIAGQLKLSSKFTAADASLTQLEAGKTSLSSLEVNGDGTVTNLSVRQNVLVTGTTQLQGAVTLAKLLTVNNNVNVSGDLTVGGTLTAGGFTARSLTSTSTLTIGGHIATTGSAPSVSAGPAVGSSGTVSVSGSDAAGTIAVNAGVGAGSGILVNLTFRSPYGETPHVLVTAIGGGANGVVYVNRSATGFSIGLTGSLSAGGHGFDYLVVD